MTSLLLQILPWYVAGPLIGLTVPLLLIIGNKSFGVSSSLRHICASCVPANIPFFNYNWKKEIWNLFFVAGIFLGGLLAVQLFPMTEPIQVHPALAAELQSYGIQDYSSLVPKDILNWKTLFSLKGLILMVLGGFLVGFGTRYAGGCTSGHAIMGLSNLQYPSLIATLSFMIGGLLATHYILPLVLSL